MIVHNDPLLYIYFGDERTCLERDIFMSDCTQEDLWGYDQLAGVKRILHLESLVLLRQMHSTEGVLVSDERFDELLMHKSEGDFLITQRELTGLGVYTADCLPIVFYDTCNRAVGICHAGWKGSVNKVALKTLEYMQKNFGTELDHLRIFFGPSAKVCCYEVTADFAKHLEPFPFKEQVLSSYDEQTFFDLPLFNKLQLESFGVKKGAFHCRYNLCTICNVSFCSNRRDKESMKRQLTVVALK